MWYQNVFIMKCPKSLVFITLRTFCIGEYFHHITDEFLNCSCEFYAQNRSQISKVGVTFSKWEPNPLIYCQTTIYIISYWQTKLMIIDCIYYFNIYNVDCFFFFWIFSISIAKSTIYFNFINELNSATKFIFVTYSCKIHSTIFFWWIKRCFGTDKQQLNINYRFFFFVNDNLFNQKHGCVFWLNDKQFIRENKKVPNFAYLYLINTPILLCFSHIVISIEQEKSIRAAIYK